MGLSLSCNWPLARCACAIRQRNFLQRCRASKVSVVDDIKDVSERIQFGNLILKNSGDMVFWCATSSSMPKVQLNAFIASLRSELMHTSRGRGKGNFSTIYMAVITNSNCSPKQLVHCLS